MAKAIEINDKLMPLHQALFVESNPCPAKYALSLLGKMQDVVRLPMVTLSEASKLKVQAAMKSVGLL